MSISGRGDAEKHHNHTSAARAHRSTAPEICLNQVNCPWRSVAPTPPLPSTAGSAAEKRDTSRIREGHSQRTRAATDTNTGDGMSREQHLQRINQKVWTAAGTERFENSSKRITAMPSHLIFENRRPEILVIDYGHIIGWWNITRAWWRRQQQASRSPGIERKSSVIAGCVFLGKVLAVWREESPRRAGAKDGRERQGLKCRSLTFNASEVLHGDLAVSPDGWHDRVERATLQISERYTEVVLVGRERHVAIIHVQNAVELQRQAVAHDEYLKGLGSWLKDAPYPGWECNLAA